MENAKARPYRVTTLPATGVVGGIYFVKSEKKVYLYTEDGWECYDEAVHASEADNASTATSIKVRAAAAADNRPIPFSALGTASKTTLSPALDDNFTYNKTTQTLKVKNLEGTATESKKVTNKLTAGSKSYDGSSAVTITKEDLGLGNVDNTSDATKRVFEANLQWGGKHHVAAFGPVDAAMIPELGANRFAYLRPAGISIEYSRDGGTTWVDYGLSDYDKTNFFGYSGKSLYIGGMTGLNADKINHQLRITITSNLATIYTNLNKFVMLVSTDGSLNCWCTLDIISKQNVDAGNNNWENVVNKQPINGWSGWNIINTKGIVTYSNSVSQYQKIRFTFGADSYGTSYPTSSSGLCIRKILAFGGVGWGTPSNLAKWGHAYTMDGNQACYFPNAVSATEFKENGTVLSQKYTPQSTTKTLSDKVTNMSDAAYTFSGNKTFSSCIKVVSGADSKIILDNTDGEQVSMIEFRESGVLTGKLGVMRDNDAHHLYWRDSPILTTTDVQALTNSEIDEIIK